MTLTSDFEIMEIYPSSITDLIKINKLCNKQFKIVSKIVTS